MFKTPPWSQGFWFYRLGDMLSLQDVKEYSYVLKYFLHETGCSCCIAQAGLRFVSLLPRVLGIQRQTMANVLAAALTAATTDDQRELRKEGYDLGPVPEFSPSWKGRYSTQSMRQRGTLCQEAESKENGPSACFLLFM